MKWLRDHILAIVALVAAGSAAYVTAATDRRVRPVELKIDNHLRDVESDRRYMLQFAEWSARAIFALCKADPDAKCPDPPTVPAR